LKAADTARSESANAKLIRGGPADKTCRSATSRDIERVLARLLAQGYLSEEFIFNAYSTNGYLRITQLGQEAISSRETALRMQLLPLPLPHELQLPRILAVNDAKPAARASLLG